MRLAQREVALAGLAPIVASQGGNATTQTMTVAVRALAGIGFLILTAPVAAHLLARAAYSAGYQPSPATTVNDLSNESTRNRSI